MNVTSLNPATAGSARASGIGRWKFASPQAFYPLAGKLIPALFTAAVVLLALGLGIGLLVAPTDHQQGEAYRIVFVHVPAAWMAMVIYLAMAFWGAVGLVLNTRLSFMAMQALAPTGALFAFLCLWTGALWGKPTWGTWWVWDARLTSELILLFLYLGFLALHAAIDDPPRADRACAVLALAGVVNIPVIYFSVQWWYTLHQGASLGFGSGVAMAPSMLCGIVAMTLALWSYAIAVVLARMRIIVRVREDAVPSHAEGRPR